MVVICISPIMISPMFECRYLGLIWGRSSSYLLNMPYRVVEHSEQFHPLTTKISR